MKRSFTTTEWIKQSNIYEVNVRQYTAGGTLKAFEAHLPRLQQMGVHVLWFMPLTPISVLKRQGTLGSYYACSSYVNISPEFGTEADFIVLVKAAHTMGFKVIIDWVANHTGWDHSWTKSHPEFYKLNEQGHFFDHNGWIDVIDLDYSNMELRRTMIDAMKFWITTFDIDGFRCDMAHLLPLDFWETARQELAQEKEGLFWLGETQEVVYHLAFDALYSWQLLHAMEHLYEGKQNLHDFEMVLNNYQQHFPPNAIHLAFTSNHDENSHSGTEYKRLGAAVKAFAVLTSTYTNCLPLVYSGQELPNKKSLLFFDKDALQWSDHVWLHQFYHALLTARANNAALAVAINNVETIRLPTSNNSQILAYARVATGNVVLVILNLSHNGPLKFTVQLEKLQGNYTSIFSGTTYQFKAMQHFEANAWDYLVFTNAQ